MRISYMHYRDPHGNSQILSLPLCELRPYFCHWNAQFCCLNPNRSTIMFGQNPHSFYLYNQTGKRATAKTRKGYGYDQQTGDVTSKKGSCCSFVFVNFCQITGHVKSRLRNQDAGYVAQNWGLLPWYGARTWLNWWRSTKSPDRAPKTSVPAQVIWVDTPPGSTPGSLVREKLGFVIGYGIHWVDFWFTLIWFPGSNGAVGWELQAVRCIDHWH